MKVGTVYVNRVQLRYKQRRWSEGCVAELERKIGQQVVVIDFLKGRLQRIDQGLEDSGATCGSNLSAC
jgi:hypothetical protein